jgi:FMN phosphatase YigB (HAD superfamily)
MTAIKAVIFDHGGVLTRGGESGTNQKMCSRAMGLSEPIVIPGLNEALKIGKIEPDEFIDEVNLLYPDAPKPLTAGVWDDIYATLVRDKEAYAFADRVSRAGFRVGMLSSINVPMATRLQQDGSYDGFSPIVLSCYQGVAKPDPAVFATVEFHLQNVLPEEILFLDDQEQHCAAARRAGWNAIRVDSSEQMAREASQALGLT